MNKKLFLNILLIFCSNEAAAAESGALFNITTNGTRENIDITLCLNGKGPVSCQKFTVSALNMMINTILPLHDYPACGIRVDTPGYMLSGCIPSNNGFCLFSSNSTIATNIVASHRNYERVIIGNPGNANDPSTGFGGINYIYQMGKYPVTIAQYTAFLNAVAKNDSYQLYNPNMASDLNIAGIKQYGSAGNYTYQVMDNNGISANRPITYISWFNAARFANWMSNNQPTGNQDNSTTEDGAYPLHGAVSGPSVVKNTINPNTGSAPQFYIPSHNEWYKSAYYNPELNGGAGGYTIYATQSNTAPGNAQGSSPNQANYFIPQLGFSVNNSLVYSPFTLNYLTDVGSFVASNSYYGTFDQNGNASQLYQCDEHSSLYYCSQGGYWFSGSAPMQKGLFSMDTLTSVNSSNGFRLASPQ